MERLTNEVLDNAIGVMQTVADCCGGLEDNFEKVKFEFLKELKEYRAIGTVEDIQEVMALCKSLQETVCKYMDIGTIEEFKALKEKNEPKKVNDIDEIHEVGFCPVCDDNAVDFLGNQYKYCPNCGQKLDWN